MQLDKNFKEIESKYLLILVIVKCLDLDNNPIQSNLPLKIGFYPFKKIAVVLLKLELAYFFILIKTIYN